MKPPGVLKSSKNKKIALRFIVISAVLLVFLATCSASLQEQIIGQWKIEGQDLNTAMIFSFKEDGSLTIWVEDLPLEGTY
jgi:hypothetical protein